MANWCFSSIEITEESEETLKFREWLLEKAADGSRGHLPDVVVSEGKRYLFDIYFEEGSDYITCLTQWVTPISEMIDIADKYKFSFSMVYEEMGELLFGEYSYDYKELILKERFLEEEDIIALNSDSEDYQERLEGLLEKKKWKVVNTIQDEEKNT